MPYSGPDDESLPENVKKKPKNKRKQWVHVFNSAMSGGADESSAFAQAYGVVNKGWIDSLYDIDMRQVSQKEADYTPMGAVDNKGCASCQWWVSPDACMLVSGDIAPTGLSKFYYPQVEYELEPMPVTIVDKAVNAIKGLFKREVIVEVEHSSSSSMKPLIFHKQQDGNLRFFATVSNNYKDRQGEIISALAHEEYVDFATKSSTYPELWLWHSGRDSKWGKVDWLDYNDGFLIASGLVDKDKEYIAENISNSRGDAEVGVSHGFLGALKDGVFHQYRTFEISALPRTNAANPWTDFNIKELGMPFSEEKKKWLVEIAGVAKDVVDKWESNVASLSEQLKAGGIEYKGTDGNIVDALSGLTDVVKTLATTVATLQTTVEASKASITELEKSMDDKVADVFKSAISKLPAGYKASDSDSNVIDAKDSSKDLDWFSGMVTASIKGATNGS